MNRMLFPLLLLLATGPVAFAQEKTDPVPQPGDAGANVYRKVLHSSVWVHSDRGGGKLATGSGSLVDKGRRLVLTNYHVVGNVKNATVFFPDYGSDKRAISDRKHYRDRTEKLGIPGEVVEIDKDADLALIRLDRLPEGVSELPLAATSPDPGQTVHSIGNPGRSGALWVYTPGKVRQVYNKKWKTKLDEKTVHEFKAKVIETDSPTNPGDSGGPLVNDKGELVGVTQGGAIDAQLLSTFVDVSEVRKLMNRRSVQALRTPEVSTNTQAKEPGKPRRTEALKSKDDGKFYSAETWKKVQPTADKLLKEKDIDFLVETYAEPPKSTLEKVKAMSQKEREKYFKDFVTARCEELKLSGVYIFACKSPGFLWVEMHGPAVSKFPANYGSAILRAIFEPFKQMKFDSGLTDAIQAILEAQDLAEKKDKEKDKK